MKTTTNECKRCGGEGMESYKHVAGGVCFLCGKTPKGQPATPAEIASARARCIGVLKGLINRATQEKADGSLAGWLDEMGVELKARVAVAPADVADRARKAFAAIGVPC